MKNTITIAWKEIRSYFTTPTAYVVGAMFLALTGVFFVFSVTSQFAQSDVREMVNWASFFLVFLAPILTMRLLAEEQKLGTMELLLTAPVRDWEVVVGKYLAALLTLAVIIAATWYYTFLLYWFGDPDTGPVLSAYFGLLLLGAATLAGGVMASSFTSNQIVAAVVGIAVLLLISFTDRLATIAQGVSADVLNGISLNAHFEDFPRGVIDTSHIFYFVSLTAVFLFIAVRSLETRRWR